MEKPTYIPINNVSSFPDEGILAISKGGKPKYYRYTRRYTKKSLWVFVKGILTKLDFNRRIATTILDILPNSI